MKTTLKDLLHAIKGKVWTRVRKRRAGCLRKKVLERYGWARIAGNPEYYDRLVSCLLDGSISEWAFRNACLIEPGGKLDIERAIRMSASVSNWIARGEGLKELQKELESVNKKS